jgi:hypothetical protein
MMAFDAGAEGTPILKLMLAVINVAQEIPGCRIGFEGRGVRKVGVGPDVLFCFGACLLWEG